MEFHKYSSIENAYRTGFIEKIRCHPASDWEWIALEKVHGANFSFFTDGKKVRIAKRTTFLAGDELQSFYDCGEILDKHRDQVLQLFKSVNEQSPPSGSGAVALGDEKPVVKEVVIYGELFGGHYPGTESVAKHIQKGVYYCPHHDFYAFDIMADGKRINYDTAVKLFKEQEMLHAKVLFRGSFDAVLKWSDEHKSDVTTLPAHFGLPDIAGNRREGHVLKPVEPAYLKSASLLLKDKNPTFSERQPTTPSTKKEAKPMDSELQCAIDTALEYVTEQRYDNVVSKIGEVSKKDVGKLVGLLSKDALEDYGKDRDSSVTLKKEQLKTLNKAVNNGARRIVLKRI